MAKKIYRGGERSKDCLFWGVVVSHPELCWKHSTLS